MRHARSVAVVTAVLGALAVSSACSSSTVLGSSDAGSSGSSGAGTSGLVARPDASPEPGPRARATVSSTLQPSSEPRGTCPVDGPYLDLGTFEPSAPVDDGALVDGLEARVSCSVVPLDASGTAFKISAFIYFDADGSPTAGLEGTIRATGSSRVVFSVGKAGDVYASNECDFTIQKPAQGLAAGRVWGEVSCYRAETIAFDKLCSVRAEVRFENCRAKQ